MPRPRPPHLVREVTRHGKTVWFFRRGQGPRVRMRAAYGTEEFEREYRDAFNGKAASGARKAASGTLRWLWDEYRQSPEWAALSPGTRRTREFIMRKVVEVSGEVPFDQIGKRDIVASRNSRASTPFAARSFLAAMRSLFMWAVEAEHADEDPTRGVEFPKIKTDGHAVWSGAEIAQFRARWPLGTRERVALEVLAGTGLRRGDAIKIGPGHVSDGVITIKTAKTGQIVDVDILPELAAAIEAGPIGATTFITSSLGRPLKGVSFSNWFRDAANAAGCAGSAHGLRKALATALADSGASGHEIDGVMGWSGGKMAALYTRKADRARNASRALKRLSGAKTP